MKIILASQNQGKLAEFNQLAKSTKISFVSPPEGSIFPQETGNTFSANALIKAKYIFSLTGQPSLGDDSGLEVDALNGAPGIFSSRYSEEGSDISNTDKLLRKMSGIKTIHRTARFRCSLVLVYKNNKNPISVEGLVEGKIAREKKGNKGFGYDPVFIPKGSKKHFAELEEERKNLISHRFEAFQSLLQKIN
mgnify:CR=1 FL=1|tara:strand:- start:3212 stop:3787 length:576 start_codon:yes stop_codon:yes gene_type:complete